MENIKEIIAEGKQLFESRRFDEAEDRLKKISGEAPRYADVLNILGVISHIKGRFASATSYFREALKINPSYTEAALNLAVLYNDLGQYEDAAKLYQRLRKNTSNKKARIEPVLRGKLSNLHADIGDIYRSVGLHGLAVEEYKKALALNPKYHDIRTKLAQALREGGKPFDSQKELRAILKEKPSYLPAIVQLGVTHYSLCNFTEAKKAWESALKKDPANEQAKMYLRLSTASVKKGKTPLKKKVRRK